MKPVSTDVKRLGGGPSAGATSQNAKKTAAIPRSQGATGGGEADDRGTERITYENRPTIDPAVCLIPGSGLGCTVGVGLINGLGSIVDRIYTKSGAASPAFNPDRESRRQAGQQFAQEAFKSGVGMIGAGATAAARTATAEATTLYRAVGTAELADIQALGRYRVVPGGTEGKYFFKTAEQASNFGHMMGDQPYVTTSVRVSPAELGRGQAINPAGEGPGYFFSTPHVPAGPVTIIKGGP
jgi:hypothetical protein